MNFGKKLGNKIRDLRIEKYMTQKQVADEIGVDRTTYAHWERGTTPQIEDIMRLATFFGVTLDDICDFSTVVSNRTSEYSAAIARLRERGINVEEGYDDDVRLITYGTAHTINKADVPLMVERAHEMHRRMMKEVSNKTFAAAVVLMANDDRYNATLTYKYLNELLWRAYAYSDRYHRAITPDVLVELIKPRLMLMSLPNRRRAWKRAAEFILNWGTTEDDEIINIDTLPEWSYPEKLFK